MSGTAEELAKFFADTASNDAELRRLNDALARVIIEAREDGFEDAVAFVMTEAKLLIGLVSSESEARAVATLADAVGANVDDLLAYTWPGDTPREMATVENGLLPAPRCTCAGEGTCS